MNGPTEVFGQDSYYILSSLERQELYPYNPQSHILFHTLVERGYRIWRTVMPNSAYGTGPQGAWLFLKLIAAFSGLGFLLGFRQLLIDMHVRVTLRAALLALAGLSVSAWFHFSAFETHSMAMPALAIYLVCLWRLVHNPDRSNGERVLFIASLTFAALVRIDLLRFAAVSALLLVLTKKRRLPLMIDLALICALTLGGTAILNRLHHNQTNSMLSRQDRPNLKLGSVANWTGPNLAKNARAMGFYSSLMPVFSASQVPQQVLGLPKYQYTQVPGIPVPDQPETGLFGEPLRNFFTSWLSGGALLAYLYIFGAALWNGPRGYGTFQMMLGAQWVSGLLFYTWFNPHEPFLWVLEFMPLQIAALSAAAPQRKDWFGLSAAIFVIAAHNIWFFYLAFR